MPVGDYSTTPGSNTSISGINIAENCPPANVNNAIRQLMADLKTLYDSLNVGVSYQPLDATLTALAGVTVAADKLVYATGADAFSTTDLSAFARTILDDANAAAVRTTIGAVAGEISGTAASGKITIGTFVITWRDHSFTGNGNTACSYGSGHTYSTWARAWVNGGDTIASPQDNFAFVSNAGLSSAAVWNSYTTHSGTVFSIGV